MNVNWSKVKATILVFEKRTPHLCIYKSVRFKKKTQSKVLKTFWIHLLYWQGQIYTIQKCFIQIVFFFLENVKLFPNVIRQIIIRNLFDKYHNMCGHVIGSKYFAQRLINKFSVELNLYFISPNFTLFYRLHHMGILCLKFRM